jgi:hypothetical protein
VLQFIVAVTGAASAQPNFTLFNRINRFRGGAGWLPCARSGTTIVKPTPCHPVTNAPDRSLAGFAEACGRQDTVGPIESKLE